MIIRRNQAVLLPLLALSFASHGVPSFAPAGFGGAGCFNKIWFDARRPGTVWAGSDVAGVFRSTDYRESWSFRGAGLGNLEIDSFAVDPFDSSHLWAGGGAFTQASRAGIYTPTDAGATWTHLPGSKSAGISFRGFRNSDAIAPDPANRGLLLSGSQRNGVFRSTDGGALERLYATFDTDAASSVLLSTDGGVTWSVLFSVPHPSGGTMNGLAVDPSNPATLYAAQENGAVYKSTDSGACFAPTVGQPSDTSFTSALAVDAQGRVFAGTRRGGLFRSSDGGATWGSVLPEEGTVWNVLVAAGALYVAGGSSNLYRSTDGGASFTKLTSFTSADDGDGVGDQGMAIAVDPSDARHLLFNRADPWHPADAGPGLFESTDGGTTWSAANDGLGITHVGSLAFESGGAVWAGTTCAGTWRRPPASAACTLGCSATAPASGTTGQALSFTLAVTPSGCAAGTPAISWTFGDGGTSSSATATHVYASAGTYAWNVTATLEGATCTRSGSVTITPASPASNAWLLPSSAHAAGANGAFYTTDLVVANTGAADGTFAVKFLGHDADGRNGAEARYPIGAGKSVLLSDVLGTAFGVSSGYGALQVRSSLGALSVRGETSTPAPSCVGGTFGQSVPAIASSDFIAAGSSRSIPGVRENAAFRTNLVLANGSESAADVNVTLVLGDGTTAATKSYHLEPLGMRQVTRVVRDLGVTSDVAGGRLVIAPASGSIAAYASVIDNLTNDPRTLLPLAASASAADKWALWSGGTKLRGADVYQRRVYPDVDGPDVMGPGPFGPPYTQADFDRLAAAGANYVNISHPGIYTEKPPFVLDPQVQANLDALLEMARKANLWAVITFRTGPGRSEFTFFYGETWFPPSLINETMWSDAPSQDAWVEMWKTAAARYKDNPVVAGYDLMAEPNSNQTRLGITRPEQFYPAYAGTFFDWNQLHPRIAAGIRSVDPSTPILTAAMGYSAPPWLPYLTTTSDPRTVYMIHQYDPGSYTHQPTQGPNTYPCDSCDTEGPAPERFDRTWLESHLAPVWAFAAAKGVPIGVNEFGLMRWEPGGTQYVSDEIEIFERNGWNYALWLWADSWPPQAVNDAFNFRHGPDPANHTDLPTTPIGDVLATAWKRNTSRPADAGAPGVFILPSSAHAAGANGAFYTTDLAVANAGASDGSFTVKFLGHDADGRGGAEVSYPIGAGKTTVLADVLGAFGVTSGYGALQIRSSLPLVVAGETSTPAPPCVGGTFGQSVPAVTSGALIAGGTSRSIPGVREGAAFRTNLVLANGSEGTADVNVMLVLADGTTAASKSYHLEPLGMRQVTRVVRDLGVSSDVAGARLVIAPASGSVAVYGSVIDNLTNDPRTLLP